MSSNQIQKGCVLDLIAPAGGVVSGNGYMIGGLLVVAQITAAVGEKFSAISEGVFEMPKEATATAFVEGELVFWDDTNKYFEKTAVGDFPAGTCVKIVGATGPLVLVKLMGFAVEAV